MKETATIAGGCYWCLEAYFQRIKGIKTVVSGYTGGHLENPTAQQVYSGKTGHAETVQITYDSTAITYRTILEIFFVMHDPTTLNRQGHDIGEHYRSAIFYHSPEQKEIAEEVISVYAQPLYAEPVVTQLSPASTFWLADDSMQNYYNNNPHNSYCVTVINPKIQKLRQKFAGLTYSE